MNYWDKIVELFQGKKKKPPIPGMDDKTSLILLLIKMAQIDGHLNHFEQMNIHILSNTLGADMMKVNQWRSSLDDVVLVLPETEEEKMDYFFRILTMMKMDMRAHPKELEMCQELGIALQFKKKKVNKAIDFMQENLEKFVSFEKFKEVMEA